MSPDLTVRQRLIDTLCRDLNAQGWNQKNKMWFVKGETNDEWLEYVGEFDGPPENRLLDLISEDKQRGDVLGVVMSTEGWAYPIQLAETFKTESALRSYWRLAPPSDHPQKVEVRQVILASSDGDVIGLVSHRDADQTTDWAQLTADDACPTGHRTIDASRALLGLNDALKQRVLQTAKPESQEQGPVELLAQLKAITDTVQGVVDGSLNMGDATIALFDTLPEEQRAELIRTMPEPVKAQFREYLSEEQRTRYGL